MSERTRAFLAVLLPGGMIEAADEVQRRLLEDRRFAGVRWVPKENFHLTVRFFGDLDRKALNKAIGVVESIDRGFSPIRVRLGSVSAFPSPSRPQVLWVGVDDAADMSVGAEPSALGALASDLDLRIRRAGFGVADKPWKSHLTLGRVKRGRKLRIDRDWSRGLTGEGGDFTIERIALMKSELRRQGARYTALRTAAAGA